MISETDGLVLDVVVAAPIGRSDDLEDTVRALRSDLDRRFPSQRTRITIACEPETAAAAAHLCGTVSGVRAVSLEPSARLPGLRVAPLGRVARLVAATPPAPPAAPGGSDRSPPWRPAHIAAT